MPDTAFASSYKSNANANSRTDTDRNAYTYSDIECKRPRLGRGRLAPPFRQDPGPGEFPFGSCRTRVLEAGHLINQRTA